MEVIIMTNGQMGISCFERSGNYNCSYRWKHCSSCRFLKALPPHLGFPLKRKFGKKLRVYGLQIKALSEEDSDNGLVGGGILEKEFEFRPSFNEYLKAMESVRTGIEKKQVRKSSGYNSKDYSRSGNISSLNRDENGVQVRRFKDHRHGERISKIMENGNGATDKEDVINHKLQYKEMRVSILNDNLGGKESNADAKVKKKLGEVTRNRRKLKNDTNSMIAEDFHVEENKMTRDTRKGPVILDVVANSGGSIRKKENFTHGSTEMFGRDLMSLEDEEVGRRRNKTSERLVSNRSFNKNCDDNRLVMERAAFKNLEEFNGVTDKPRVSRMEMEERIQRLAKFLNGADIGMPEWMFSKTMRSAKIKYTDHSILRVIQLLGKLGNWRRVLQVIEWLQMRERFKSHKLRNIYTTALNVLGKARRPVEALNVFHAMQKQMSTYPDLVAYHCIAVTLGQAGYMKELFDVIDFMRSPPKKKFKIGTLEKWDPRLEPDIVVYNAVLNACVRRKQWEGAFWVLQQLKEQGQQPSTSTYGLIMEVMFACGKYNLVHEFFRKMQKSSIPNALAYNVVVNTLWREGKTDEAVMAIQEMEKRGIVGSAALYYDLARCLCSAGRCQEALLQIEKICKVASKPLVVTYTGLIQACLDSGNIQNATYIFNEMKSFCSPNLVTCNIMLKAYLEHRLLEDAKELFYNMLEDSSQIKNKTGYKIRVIPDIYSFNTILDACSADKRWDDFEYIYRRMLRHGYHFNTKRHLRMILDASRAGKEELLEITWEHLVEADRTPPASLVKERFCIMLEKENYESALDCIVSTCPTSDLQPFSKPAWLNLFKENRQRFKKDTLVHLMHELSIVVARSNPETRIQRNLLTSCHDFLRNQTEVPEMNLAEVVSAVQSETALKLSMK